MDNRKYIDSAVLVLTLLAAGSSFAEESATTMPDQDTSYGKKVRAKIANMTADERKAFFGDMITNISSMTPEQREAFRDVIRSPIAGMNKEERISFRAEMKYKMDKMTPEDREAAKSELMKHHADHRTERMGHLTERMDHRAERIERRQ